MEIQEYVPLRPKTTMRIGGNARFFAELKTKNDAEKAAQFAKEKNLPLLVLGGGSNTVFAEGTISALIVHVAANAFEIQDVTVRVDAGCPLGTLVNELAKKGLDLSALSGIPGSVGGAVFGNAGQGPKGTWFDHFVREVTAYVDGAWRTLAKEECRFRYRESVFKEMTHPLIWEAVLTVPKKPAELVEREIASALKRRGEAQPHAKTAGSCFKALPDGTPAWKPIDAAGLRGTKSGGISLSEKHANFLVNDGEGTFDDALSLVRMVRERVGVPLESEMRFIDTQGRPVR